MDFTLKLRFIALAEQYDSIAYSEYDDEADILYVYFESGESWKIERRA